MIDALFRLFDYQGRKQERLLELQRAADLAEATRHERQLEMMEMVLERQQATNTGLTDAIIEIAKGVQKNADALNRWFALFEQTQGEGSSHVVRAVDEHEEFVKREAERLRKVFPDAFGSADTDASVDFLQNMFTPNDIG